MLDSLKSALQSSASMRAELAEIEIRLADLAQQREDRRLEGGKLVLSQGSAPSAQAEREARAVFASVATIDAEAGALRARRREIAERLRPEAPARAALVSVPMSPELIRAQEALDRARDQRQALVAATQNVGGDDKDARALNAKREALESEILRLRAAREPLLSAYNEAVNAALRPLVLAAAADLRSACEAFLAAQAALNEIAQVAPAAQAGTSSQLAAVASIDNRAAHAGARIASGLLDSWAGSDEAVA